ncbi:hypothetical protein [Pseudomonas nunensis]|uniref:hypothetical protein n=1 Tax=Pseudomonas nunensis TaxID=2961896 RepID=UPI0025B1D297|nr:hypothetical protein [Pseudomonas nunensis]MDN3223672.1 hypothetical protein [Pseudomonas nunensis]
MALTECFECKQSISSEVISCIHCGAPVAARRATSSQAAPISFGHRPRDEQVPEVSTVDPEPQPQVEPTPEIPAAPVSRHRRRGVPVNVPATDAWADTARPVEGWLKIMAFLLPPFFVWFLLRPGHSLQQRLIGFGWLALLILASSISPKP